MLSDIISEETLQVHYADIIIKNFRNILGCLDKIQEDTPNYDYILDLSERVNKELKNIASPE